MLLLFVVSDAIAQNTIDNAAPALGNRNVVLAAHVIWGGLYGAFSALVTVVAYHDLRVAKEGIHARALAAVFT